MAKYSTEMPVAEQLLDQINADLGSNGGFERCRLLLIEALTRAAQHGTQRERERCAKMSWEIGGIPNQQNALSYGKGKRYQWQRDYYYALTNLAREIATAIRSAP